MSRGMRNPLEERRGAADTHHMSTRRSPRLLLPLLLPVLVALLATPLPGAAASVQHASTTGPGVRGVPPDYRPDAWIKLCGLSTGCTIDPLPHPWRGNDRYNHTGAGQTISVRMEDGEGVRFWILLQNDGAQADTLVVQGCQGNRRFVVNKVLLGKHKRPEAGTTDITRKFKNGTASWSFPPYTEHKRSVFTLNIIAPTTAEGVSYRCVMRVHSENDPTITDTIVTEMTTY
jgi:hypothetical protein